MYATAFKTNPLDPATGNKYRNEILLPGGSREEMDSLKVIHYKFRHRFALTSFEGIPGTSSETRCIHAGDPRSDWWCIGQNLNR